MIVATGGKNLKIEIRNAFQKEELVAMTLYHLLFLAFYIHNIVVNVVNGELICIFWSIQYTMLVRHQVPQHVLIIFKNGCSH